MLSDVTRHGVFSEKYMSQKAMNKSLHPPLHSVKIFAITLKFNVKDDGGTK